MSGRRGMARASGVNKSARPRTACTTDVERVSIEERNALKES